VCLITHNSQQHTNSSEILFVFFFNIVRNLSNVKYTIQEKKDQSPEQVKNNSDTEMG